MTDKIESLFHDDKYDLAIYYFKEIGISIINDLKNFDFDELFFVPGLDEEIVADIHKKYDDYINRAINEGVEDIIDDIACELCLMDDDDELNHFTNEIEPEKNHVSINTASLENTKYINQNEIYYDISLEHVYKDILHGYLFIYHCKKKGINNISELKDFDFSTPSIRGIGTDSMIKIHQAYLNAISAPLDMVQDTNFLEVIPEINKKLSIKMLCHAGIPQSSINLLNERGIIIVEDLFKEPMNTFDYSLISKAIPFLKESINERFSNQFHSLNENHRTSLIQRSQGKTLQQIAEIISITRERVRQILGSANNKLLIGSELIADAIFNKKNDFLYIEDLNNLFNDLKLADICKHVLMESKEVQYLSFSDKFVRRSICPNDLEKSLYEFTIDTIGDGFNFYDNLEKIESVLPKYGLGFLDFEDIMNFLVKSGYRFFGDYVTRGKQSYAIICYDAITKYFQFDIKLDNDEENTDLAMLRKIIQKNYGGLVLPDNNRALTARIASLMVLSGRGRYCPIEKVCYSPEIFEEIYQYIHESNQTTFYYHELFTLYEGKFLAKTNIHNHHFLHGMMKYLYPSDFNYERDMLIKNGAARQDINIRLSNLIIGNNGPMTKTEIKDAIPGINDFVISFTVARIPKLIPWDYNSFNHMDNIKYDDDDITALSQIIECNIKKHNGYLNDTLLFKAVKRDYSDFIEKNSLCNELNLYYIIGYIFKDQYRFRRPHIISQDFPIGEFNIVSIAKTLLGSDSCINYSSYMKLTSSLCWAEGTLYSVFTELTRKMMRTSIDDYIDMNTFEISDSSLKMISEQLAFLVDNTGYYAINSIFSFNAFPYINYEWNTFLLEAIIDNYDTGCKIINQQVKDRRTQRGIIINASSPIETFEDLIMTIIKREGISSLSEVEMQNYLKNKGLILNIIPQEIYKYDGISFKNEMFIFKK